MNDRLYRSREDRLLGGVCGGLAERLDLDPSLVRIGWVLLTIFSGGIFLLLYIVMLIVVPEEPPSGVMYGSGQPWPPGPGAVPGWQAPGTPPTGATPAGATPPTAAAPSTAEPGAEAAAAAGIVADGAATGPGGAAPASSTGGPTTWAAPPSARDIRRARRDARRAARGDGNAVAIVIGLVLVLFGGWLLLRPYIPGLEDIAFWPVIIVAIGLLLIVQALRIGGDRPS